jgi:hypothetical protein
MTTPTFTEGVSSGGVCPAAGVTWASAEAAQRASTPAAADGKARLRITRLLFTRLASFDRFPVAFPFDARAAV